MEVFPIDVRPIINKNRPVNSQFMMGGFMFSRFSGGPYSNRFILGVASLSLAVFAGWWANVKPKIEDCEASGGAWVKGACIDRE